MLARPVVRNVAQSVARGLTISPLGGLDAAIRALFNDGTPGAWYDPSDFSTLFTDSAGTTPVTSLEQPVGLMLDKSRGLVLGSELVTGSAVAYTGNGTVSEAGGVYTATCTTNGNYGITFSMSSAATAGKRYLMTFEVVANSAPRTIYGWAATASADSVNAGTTTGQKQGRLTGGVGGTAIAVLGGVAGESFSVRNISVRELPGYHAYHTPGDTTTRPTVSRRINLLTKTEQFADAVWLKAAASVSSATAPDGTSTAWTITGDGTSAIHSVRQGTSASGGRSFTFIAKAGTNNFLQVFTDGTPNEFANFNLSTGAVGSVGTDASGATITAYGSGWYVCSVTFPVANSTTHIRFALVTSATAARAETNTLSTTVSVWRPMYVNSDLAALPYQRVNTTTDYDTSSVFPTFLRCDGVNDSLQTNAIDFSGTDKMFVGAAVRKLSDAAQNNVLELSANASGNNGSFYFAAPNGPGPNYIFVSRGSTTQRQAYIAAGYAPPITNVAVGIGDISGDLVILRLNGVQVAQSTADQGTGNYGNHKLYLFMRGGTSLPFNGWMFGLLVKGATLTSSQIALAERWLASKTKTVTLA